VRAASKADNEATTLLRAVGLGAWLPAALASLLLDWALGEADDGDGDGVV
jgi:hypothetical protein